MTSFLNDELKEGELFLNLASNEYFSVINTGVLNSKVITPQFKDFKNGTLKMISFYEFFELLFLNSFLIRGN